MLNLLEGGQQGNLVLRKDITLMSFSGGHGKLPKVLGVNPDNASYIFTSEGTHLYISFRRPILKISRLYLVLYKSDGRNHNVKIECSTIDEPYKWVSIYDEANLETGAVDISIGVDDDVRNIVAIRVSGRNTTNAALHYVHIEVIGTIPLGFPCEEEEEEGEDGNEASQMVLRNSILRDDRVVITALSDPKRIISEEASVVGDSVYIYQQSPTFLVVTFPQALEFGVGVALRVYNSDSRYYTYNCQVQLDDGGEEGVWVGVFQNRYFMLDDSFFVWRPKEVTEGTKIRALRFNGINTKNAYLHFTHFEVHPVLPSSSRGRTSLERFETLTRRIDFLVDNFDTFSDLAAVCGDDKRLRMQKSLLSCSGRLHRDPTVSVLPIMVPVPIARLSDEFILRYLLADESMAIRLLLDLSDGRGGVLDPEKSSAQICEMFSFLIGMEMFEQVWFLCDLIIRLPIPLFDLGASFELLKTACTCLHESFDEIDNVEFAHVLSLAAFSRMKANEQMYSAICAAEDEETRTIRAWLYHKNLFLEFERGKLKPVRDHLQLRNLDDAFVEPVSPLKHYATVLDAVVPRLVRERMDAVKPPVFPAPDVTLRPDQRTRFNDQHCVRAFIVPLLLTNEFFIRLFQFGGRDIAGFSESREIEVKETTSHALHSLVHFSVRGKLPQQPGYTFVDDLYLLNHAEKYQELNLRHDLHARVCQVDTSHVDFVAHVEDSGNAIENLPNRASILRAWVSQGHHAEAELSKMVRRAAKKQEREHNRMLLLSIGNVVVSLVDHPQAQPQEELVATLRRQLEEFGTNTGRVE